MALSDYKEDTVYTYADYKSWREDERIEIVNGEPYMQAAPSTAHQEVVLNMAVAFREMLKGAPCKVFIAPLSVRLSPADDESDKTVVEPDIFVVCDESKMTESGCKGAPDMIVEVTSPSTARTDRVIKFRKYQQAGVREYWLLDPDSQTVHVNILRDSAYVGAAYESPEIVPVTVLPGCSIDLGNIFPHNKTMT